MAPGLSQLHFLSLFFFFHQEVAFGNAASGIQRERERGNDFCLYNSCSSRLSSVIERVGGLDEARWILGMRIPQGTGLGAQVWGFPLHSAPQLSGFWAWGHVQRSTLVRLRGEPGLGLGSERGSCFPLPLTPQSAFKMRLLPLGCGCWSWCLELLQRKPGIPSTPTPIRTRMSSTYSSG